MSKVLALVTFKIYPADMGGQKGVADFYMHLAKHHDVVLTVSEDNPATDPKLVRELFPNKKIAKNFFRLRRLKSIARREKAEIIISEHSYPGFLAFLIARGLNLPFIIHSHNIEALRFKKMGRSWWKLYLQYEKWIHRQADHNFFISRDDLEFALKFFKLHPEECSVVTYGVSEPSPFTPFIAGDKKVLIFNGSLDYKPNEEAVKLLIEKVNPVLRKKLEGYRIIITGKGASKELVQQIAQVPEMDYLGFVENLSSLFSKVSVFLNPVLNDTGIKTKVVEAIGQHCTVVSTASGANGMEKDLCGDKLRVVADGDWEGFAAAVSKAANEERRPTPAEYFNFYLWRNIASRASETIRQMIDAHHFRQHK